ncbi:SUMO-activating enzyme subunit 1 [Tribolium castaneum]|uniref:Nedd8-activating enzyme E1 regulatory subunit-like Protein n=1 Tax=Tribolium castaneum TaxID=7070 RepID=D6WWI4_TRICA|nr:PREDICTED: SUMO-activating enzyme subunit 1 [Tribolium castaneum]EFA08714.1 Nedd8-activating enzyme E1 regulatory subunit-like Protein [Tribolium castaneum]|eukprot:XP_974447.1 PREDICTED: SUMO-activating enzyme subunit 1 [Tribolium castaneum]
MSEKQLSTDEAEVYDRQIRLWGIEAQEKLRAANVLLIGVRSLGSEIAKNILLSGINSLTILDDGVVSQDDVTRNFLLHEKVALGSKIAEQVLPRAQALNPLVKIVVDTGSVAAKSGDYFKEFTIVVATKLKFELILKIDGFCREHNVKFIYGEVAGFFGYSVSDFQDHEYFEDRIQLATGAKRGHEGDKKTKRIKGKLTYPPLNKVLVLPNTKQDIGSIKKMSRPNKLFVCMLMLLEFRKRFERDPDLENKSDEIEELRDIATEIIKLYQFTKVNVDNLLDLVFGEVSPVCAILGGIMSQEVIKAASHKEVTINNIFLFDPVTYSGKELTVGA